MCEDSSRRDYTVASQSQKESNNEGWIEIGGGEDVSTRQESDHTGGNGRNSYPDALTGAALGSAANAPSTEDDVIQIRPSGSKLNTCCAHSDISSAISHQQVCF